MTNRNGRGRPNKPAYVTSWGETIDGAYRGKDNKLRIIGSSRPAFALTDERRAVAKIRRALATRNGESGNAKHWTEVLSMSDAERQRWLSEGRIQADKDGWLDDAISAAVNAERHRIRSLILSHPKLAAVDLDIPYLSDYPARPERPNFTLAELGQAYLDKARNKAGKPLVHKNKLDSERRWKEFLQITGARIPQDLDKETLREYAEKIQSRNYAPATVKAHFIKVKAVLNWGMRKTDDTEILRKALDNTNSVFDMPQTDSEPNPISRDHYRALLDAADTRMRAILLLGLNCAMHAGEIASIKKSEIDGSDFASRRSKTGQRRVAHLWERTIAAVKKHLEETPNNHSDSLFVARTGRQMSGESIRQLFVRMRNRLGIPQSVTLEGLRDAAYTLACQADAYYAKFVAGHTIRDESAKYVVRGTNPNVKKCCEAIERHFFGV